MIKQQQRDLLKLKKRLEETDIKTDNLVYMPIVPMIGIDREKENLEDITKKWLDQKAEHLSVLADLQNLIRYLLKFEKTKNHQKFIDALIWCSGSDDFQVGGKARKGWEKICLPLLKDKK